ncbi:hypothetical protein [Kutzneria sp. CA-103260]|uniref:hypothetical protein n=1 Tax=Kutzneria sp. CA-103260 TaxID=2802641 RepID=UPI001BA9E741|nr:hypothetical protein [Kutzneria sp. CA-103260]QUQ70604.1 hypothetical protein JJ691_83870 [Kutzneria sp. CA-103260]
MAKERRRRAYLPAGIVVLAVLGGGQYYLSNIFAPADTGTGGSGGSGGGGAPGAGIPLAGAANPSIAVSSVYAAVGNDDPAKVCPAFFSAHGELNFAAAFTASSCEDAVHKAHTKVTDAQAYAGLTVPTTAVHLQGTSSATVNSCAMSVSGGDSLGMFVLSHTANGWVVDDLKPDPTPCPPAPTN